MAFPLAKARNRTRYFTHSQPQSGNSKAKGGNFTTPMMNVSERERILKLWIPLQLPKNRMKDHPALARKFQSKVKPCCKNLIMPSIIK